MLQELRFSNNYLRGGSFNPHITAIKDSYNLHRMDGYNTWHTFLKMSYCSVLGIYGFQANLMALQEIVHLKPSPGYMESPGTDQSKFFSGMQIFRLYSV